MNDLPLLNVQNVWMRSRHGVLVIVSEAISLFEPCAQRNENQILVWNYRELIEHAYLPSHIEVVLVDSDKLHKRTSVRVAQMVELVRNKPHYGLCNQNDVSLLAETLFTPSANGSSDELWYPMLGTQALEELFEQRLLQRPLTQMEVGLTLSEVCRMARSRGFLQTANEVNTLGWQIARRLGLLPGQALQVRQQKNAADQTMNNGSAGSIKPHGKNYPTVNVPVTKIALPEKPKRLSDVIRKNRSLILTYGPANVARTLMKVNQIKRLLPNKIQVVDAACRNVLRKTTSRRAV